MFPDFVDHIRDYKKVKEKPSSTSRFQEYLSVKRQKRERRPGTEHRVQDFPGQQQASFDNLLPRWCMSPLFFKTGQASGSPGQKIRLGLARIIFSSRKPC
ncbi:hypothetical protein LMH87_001174 [Akanthomyces muscarius]|uniref:Uncharacterized protein n=1 Tax=Akanthomyces muscarius TaxID=2231603 RepID=A0A9W8QG04_AKAMU|nr:hypothetical protein LMH87_001174 [Akanthomyces muscarius]KAJ4155954.1 hypothetical protein LMH87_001174 [Akanthomyces muscarius]